MIIGFLVLAISICLAVRPCLVLCMIRGLPDMRNRANRMNSIKNEPECEDSSLNLHESENPPRIPIEKKLTNPLEKKTTNALEKSCTSVTDPNNALFDRRDSHKLKEDRQNQVLIT